MITDSPNSAPGEQLRSEDGCEGVNGQIVVVDGKRAE